ncbi:MAG: hypothetical protein ACLR4X_04340 [Clostridia bacterium]
MKVLFAVNDENISTSIVKKYQKQYKEIISYKNVYYFNAILKELQRNKNYDRVVISEDLEEFTSSSLEQKDKFIFDRLDSISDEAVASDGSDIPIILICSERRTKSEDILVKLFGIGIYNAIIGEDRSTEEVCRLINKPRSKKEAKLYYKIDSENVNYEKENDSDVSEVEMRNILMHFKKLGNNEEKYAESFKNIVSQYTQEQLKVIIAVLPNNVKEVLSETSPEYQKIVYPTGKEISKTTKGKTGRKGRKGTSEKLLEVESNPMMSKPVVVPTTMKSNMYLNIDKKKPVKQIEEIEDEDDDLTEVDDIIEEKPKRRGRPRKNPLPEETEEKPKRRGRPRKTPLPEEQEEPEEEKVDVLPGFDEDDEDDEIEEVVPKKVSKVNAKKEEDTSILPGFDEEDDDDEDYDDDEYEEEYDNHDDEDDYEDYSQRIDDRFSHPVQKSAKGNIYTSSSNQDMKKYDNVFEDGEFESLLTGDKKVVAFVGTSKNGTSFVVNNVAQILSSMGINTAILDATQNKNAYYIYTKNDEDLRRTAVNSLDNLMAGRAEGIKVNNNLSVYTNIPSQNEEIKNSHSIMETLVKNHSLILIDCDFNTPIEYFAKAQELYLVQSMDVLTIQPLTEFLRELKIKNALEESKIRIVLNKILRVRGVTGKNIVGGMSNYNDPEMSFMTELFDRNTVKVAAQIPFDEDVYAKYLEGLIECEIKLNGYPKEFKAKLTTLAETIYPLLPNNNNNNGKKNKKNSKQGYSSNNQYPNSFSSGMNDTLNSMRNRY